VVLSIVLLTAENVEIVENVDFWLFFCG